jgi:hypothetical protein
MSIDEVLDRLEAAERDFVGRELMAPVVGHSQVMVRIAGVVCRLRVIERLPKDFGGWAILRAVSTSAAEFICEASLARVASYLALFPSLRLIVVHPHGNRWLSLPAQLGDRRFRIEGAVPVELADRKSVV